MEVLGILKVKGEVKTFGASFNKREVVITVADDKYPQDIAVELHQDKCDLINSYNVGDSVKVSVNLRGKEWINPQGVARYFNSLVGWRIEAGEANDIPEPPQQIKVEATEPDDLPF